jgi:AmmeMemoRadiSam system protein B
MRRKTSTLAGTWYPGTAKELRAQVEDLLAAAPEPAVRSVAAAIVPHAGYRYSGAVAAAAYRCLIEDRPRRAVLLAPSHRHGYRGIVTLDADAFETPLGIVPIEPLQSAPAAGLVRVDGRPFHGEHSLEIQLPFLQCSVPDVAVVPLLCGSLSPDDHVGAAELLDDLSGADTVVLVSSDFTHFGARFGYEPFRPRGAAEARQLLRELDMGAIEAALEGDPAAFRDYIERTGATVCGRVPIEAFLTWALPRLRGRLLAYATSLDVTGDYDHCVSYAALAFPRS